MAMFEEALGGGSVGRVVASNTVVAQLVEWLLPTREICSSNPYSGKVLSASCN